MDSLQLRNKFISFFTERGHVARPSASLIPTDPTLLLTSAGMVPFKPYFLGDQKAPWDRATSVQKCVRTSDIDIIGTTQRHVSFFEMLGNFSFGDYFKDDAIKWAYEFSTEVMGLDADLLWYTVHESDDEAAEIWIDGVGVPAERVQRGGEDNFWQMGVPGPCGPSSELFLDRGPRFGEEGGPIGGGEDRYVEFWNLVFMQNIQDEPYHVIGDLPAKNIDTGMGLDRMVAILQDVPSVFDIDTTRHVRDVAGRAIGKKYGDSPESDLSLRILADHGRSVTFLIADGVVPSNDGRGYVLRRLLRRAVRHAWLYDSADLILPPMVDATIEAMGGWYTELVDDRDFIVDVVTREEEKFRRTLESGHRLLEDELGDGPTELSGATLFKLHDTYGFPFELTREIAAEMGVGVDSEGFHQEMEAQKQRARAAWRGSDQAVAAENIYRAVLDVAGLTDFVGYSEERSTAIILSILSDGEPVDRADVGMEVEIFLDRTPFYAESGGQVGDTGTLDADTGSAAVVDTQHAIQGLHGHSAKVTQGHIVVGQGVVAAIDSPRRDAIRKSHTGTHVLHWALRDVLGEHAGQAGSLVEPGRVRFDFSHFNQVADEELLDIEQTVNSRLIDNGQVTTAVTSKDEAQEMGAIAFFGDKYGETVRVVRVGDFSTELCGGTHTRTAAEVGPFLVTSESSIGSNLRRIEALTGLAAYRRMTSIRQDLEETGKLLRSSWAEVPQKVQALLDTVEGLESQLDDFRAQRRNALGAELAGTAEDIDGISYVVATTDGLNGNELRQLALGIRDRLANPSVIVLGSTDDGKGGMVGVVADALVAKGLSAADLISAGAAELGGGGSRDPVLAQAGGPRGEAIESAVQLARAAVESALRNL